MSRAVKINITIPGDELKKIDQFVKSEGMTRSGLILEALSFFMERAEKENAERMKRKTIQKAAVDIKKFRLKSGKWDGVAEIRKWRELR
jgi:metal-responsive CopG/Arc/MetJ family transcriptional regulator